MALPLRPRAIPQCTTCLHSYAWAGLAEAMGLSSPTLRQQTRGKKKMVNNSDTITVQLLKDVKTFGRTGTIVPVSRGLMRNQWFKRRIAAYIPLPEMRSLRTSGAPVVREYTYGIDIDTAASLAQTNYTTDFDARMPPPPAPVRKAPEVKKITPERSLELLQIFVPQRLDFYRPVIIEEPQPETEKPSGSESKNERQQRTASSAAADLLAARTQVPLEKPKATGPQAIYGSVSTHDILVMIRAAIAGNDEAARVTLTEDDIVFAGSYAAEEIEAGKIKRLGDFTVEVTVRGAEEGSGIRRTVRVSPQEG